MIEQMGFKKNSDMFVLSKGSNGSKNWGCMIQSELTPEECKRQGKQYEWECNTYTLNGQSDENLFSMGFIQDEINFIRKLHSNDQPDEEDFIKKQLYLKIRHLNDK